MLPEKDWSEFITESEALAAALEIQDKRLGGLPMNMIVQMAREPTRYKVLPMARLALCLRKEVSRLAEMKLLLEDMLVGTAYEEAVPAVLHQRWRDRASALGVLCTPSDREQLLEEAIAGNETRKNDDLEEWAQRLAAQVSKADD
jgi:NAD-specific glutamate dehydrogenase